MRLLTGLFPFALAAQIGLGPLGQVPIRPANQKHGLVRGASNGTPIQITFEAAPGFVVGETILCSGIPGNHAANGIHKVKTVAGATITITDLNDVDRAGSGAWNNGDWLAERYGGWQLCGQVNLHAMKGPGSRRLTFDPTGDSVRHAFANVWDNLLADRIETDGVTATVFYTVPHNLTTSHHVCVYGAAAAALNCTPPGEAFAVTGVPSATSLTFSVVGRGVAPGTYNAANSTYLTVSAWGHAQNPNWAHMYAAKAQMLTYCPGGVCRRGADFTRNWVSAIAEICYTNRADTTSCDVAKQSILMAETAAHNFACTQIGNACKSDQGDYLSFTLFHLAAIYEVVRPLLTVGERQAFAAKMLNTAFDTAFGSPGAHPQRLTTAGTVSFPGGLGGATATGSGFSALAPGMALFKVPATIEVDDEDFAYIESIASDTSMTVSGGVAISGPIYYAEPWTTGKLGAINMTMHHAGMFGGQQTTHPEWGGNSSQGVTPLDNMSISKMDGAAPIGLALCEDDARGCFHAGTQLMFWSDYTRPTATTFLTGFTWAGSNYQFARVAVQDMKLRLYLRNSVIGGPDYTGAHHLTQSPIVNRMLWMLHPRHAGPEQYSAWAFGADGTRSSFADTSGFSYGWASTVAALPYTNTDARKLVDWLRNKRGWSGSALYAGLYWKLLPASILPLAYDPEENSQYLFRKSSAGGTNAACAATARMYCYPEVASGSAFLISRVGRYFFGGDLTSLGTGDHATPLTGDFVYNHDGDLLIASDHGRNGAPGQGLAQLHRRNQVEITDASQAYGIYSYPRGAVTVMPNYATITGWHGSYHAGRSDGRFAAAVADLVPTWRADQPTTVVGQVVRMFHLKGVAQPLAVVYRRIQTATPVIMRSHTHFAQNGQAAVSTLFPAEGVTTFDQPTRRVFTNIAAASKQMRSAFLLPAGGHVYTENVDGTYTGGGGDTFRVSVCSGSGSCQASTTLEVMEIHKAGTGAVTLTLTELNPSSGWTGFTSPDWGTLLVDRGTPGIPPAVSASAGGYMATVPAGDYTVKLNGSTVCAAVNVPAGDGHLFCEIPSAGTVTVESTSGGGGSAANSSALGGTLRSGGSSSIK